MLTQNEIQQLSLILQQQSKKRAQSNAAFKGYIEKQLQQIQNKMKSRIDQFFQPHYQSLGKEVQKLDRQEVEVKRLRNQITQAKNYLDKFTQLSNQIQKDMENRRLEHNQLIIEEMRGANQFYLEKQKQLSNEHEIAQQNYDNIQIKSKLIQINPDFNLEVSNAEEIEAKINDLEQRLSQEREGRTGDVERFELEVNRKINQFKKVNR